jgi:dihydroxyacid dehydratase/phosphogluconate dehydratase
MDPRGRKIQMAAAVRVAQAVGGLFSEGATSVGLCDKTLPMLMELSVINMAVIMAVQGTAIEMGSVEALWETQRVLRGIEQRVNDRLVAYHEEAANHPEVAKKYNGMRSDR